MRVSRSVESTQGATNREHTPSVERMSRAVWERSQESTIGQSQHLVKVMRAWRVTQIPYVERLMRICRSDEALRPRILLLTSNCRYHRYPRTTVAKTIYHIDAFLKGT